MCDKKEKVLPVLPPSSKQLPLGCFSLQAFVFVCMLLLI
jgi:hypothetical protein